MSAFDKDPMRNLPLVTPPRPAEKRAAGWQIALATILAIAIVGTFLWGINNQRDETGGQQTAATQPVPATPQVTGQQAPQSPPGSSSGQEQQQGGQQQQGAGAPPATTGQRSNTQRGASQEGGNPQKSNQQLPSSGQNEPKAGPSAQ